MPFFRNQEKAELLRAQLRKKAAKAWTPALLDDSIAKQDSATVDSATVDSATVDSAMLWMIRGV